MNAYVASPIKRARASRSEMEARAEVLLDIAEAMQPCTVRQVFYQATVAASSRRPRPATPRCNACSRTAAGRLAALGLDRRQHPLAAQARHLGQPRGRAREHRPHLPPLAVDRRAAYVEIWLEKDALAGVLLPVTSRWDVPLMVTRGYSSLSFLYEAASYIGDVGPAGLPLPLRRLRSFGAGRGREDPGHASGACTEAEIYFQQLAVRPWQIADWRLPTRPTKETDSRTKKWTGGESVELDAIDANQLRQICDFNISAHADPQYLAVIKAAEESEREFLTLWATDMAGGPEP